MKLTLTWPVTGAPNGTFILIESPGTVPYSNFQINGAHLIQEVAFFRAKSKRFYDRGNAKTEISFDTSRLFGSQVEAESFILMHATQFPPLLSTSNGGPFLATFIAGGSGAGATVSRFLRNAAIEVVHSSIMGCTGKFSYRLTGGAMAATPN